MRMFKLFSIVLGVRLLLSCPQGFLQKLRILRAIFMVRLKVVCATDIAEQLAIVSAVLKLKAPGAVVECGTYQGASAVALSLACAIAGRKLYICDSFNGLPEPAGSDQDHAIVRDSLIATYQKGSWLGSLEVVRSNIQKYGDLSVCSFVEGYFDQTLPRFDEPVALAFCDVDLVESLKTCLQYLWPLMTDGGLFFAHEAHHYEIASLFYDRQWWSEMEFQAPGLVGAGSGIGLFLQADGTFGSSLGYTIKNPTATEQSFERGKDTVCQKINQPLMR
jgi:O-methyltransferase